MRPPSFLNLSSLQRWPQLKINCDDEHTSGRLPGHPRIHMSSCEQLNTFLSAEFCSKDVDGISSFLWMMSLQSSANISPLHRQRVKQREIIVTEDPKLHLVWFHDRIFIKPLPLYLCSSKVWEQYLLSPDSPLSNKDEILRSAMGYLRTWFFLIRHESDFRIAQETGLGLIPKQFSWEEFCDFSSLFDQILDSDVSLRYNFGEIRLSRLNFYTKLLLWRRSYQRIYPQYGTYFARFYGPLLFAMAIMSVLLNALQVIVAVDQVSSNHWPSAWKASRLFGVMMILLMLMLSLSLFILFASKFVLEWKKALYDRWHWVRQADSPTLRRSAIRDGSRNTVICKLGTLQLQAEPLAAAATLKKSYQYGP